MARVRAFLALNFPLGILRRIGDEVTQLKPGLEAAGWRAIWVPPANLHLTLKFFGHIEEAATEAIHGRLRRALAAATPFDVEVRGVGAFPDAASARVLWIGLGKSAALEALHEAVEREMEALGLPHEPRPFHPHLTIARFRAPGPAPLGALLEARTNLSFGTARPTEVVLYESRLRRAGAEYIALGRIPLGGVAPRPDRERSSGPPPKENGHGDRRD